MEKLIREVILKRTIEDSGVSEDIAEKVIAWSYRKANEATRNFREVELSGLGIFKVSPSKAAKKAKRTMLMIEAIQRRIDNNTSKNIELDNKKIESCKETVNYCLSKLNDEDGAKQNIGRVEESSTPI